MARYAVLFKSHFWDDFVQRQLDRLKTRVGGDVFVFIDESKGPAHGVQHDPARVLRATQADIEQLGLACADHASQYWFSADYALHLLTRREPDYAYYVTVEFDLVVQIDLDPVIERLDRENIDFVGQPILDPPIEQFHWLPSAIGVYELSDMRHWLTCISIFSRRAAAALFERRRDLSDRFRAGEITTWPMCEIAIATEMSIGGFRMMELSEFGPLDFYQWAPPYDESSLPRLAAGAFVHPLLDGNRFVAKMLQWHTDHEAFLDKDGPVWQRFGNDATRRLVLPLLFDEERRRGRLSYRSRIIELMHEVGDDAYLAHHGRDGRNLALNKRTMQSSSINGPPPPELSNEAVAGVVTGTASFHTEADDRAWWMVDLERPAAIEEVRVFNRMDVPARADGLVVLTSDDLRDWREAGRHEGPSFGGADGRPLVIPVGQAARFVRVELPGRDYLHLDQVQVMRPGRR